MEALPTLMARVDSYAFRNIGPGLVWDRRFRDLQPLTMEERERLLGYDTGCSAAPGVTPEERHRALGGSFDANAVSNLLAAAVASRWYYLKDEQVHNATSAMVEMAEMASAVSAASAAHHSPAANQALSDNINDLVTSLAEDLES